MASTVSPCSLSRARNSSNFSFDPDGEIVTLSAPPIPAWYAHVGDPLLVPGRALRHWRPTTFPSSSTLKSAQASPVAAWPMTRDGATRPAGVAVAPGTPVLNVAATARTRSMGPPLAGMSETPCSLPSDCARAPAVPRSRCRIESGCRPMSASRALLGSLVIALACAAACRSAAPPAVVPPGLAAERPGPETFSFRLSKAKLRASGASDALIDRIGANAFNYFRVLAEPFKHRTCESFRDLRWRLPSRAVHGDAHLEQFVVTDDDFGLADFDNAGFGPAIVDLVRYAASLHLACREMGGPCDPEQAVTAYFSAYRAALDHLVVRT